jgi:hypothetical protein
MDKKTQTTLLIGGAAVVGFLLYQKSKNPSVAPAQTAPAQIKVATTPSPIKQAASALENKAASAAIAAISPTLASIGNTIGGALSSEFSRIFGGASTSPSATTDTSSYTPSSMISSDTSWLSL